MLKPESLREAIPVRKRSKPTAAVPRKHYSIVLRVLGFIFAGLVGILFLVNDDGPFPIFAPANKQSPSPHSNARQRTSGSVLSSAQRTPDFSASDLKWKRGEFGLSTITGTVTNNTSRSYGYAQVEINLYDKSGTLVGSTLANVNNLAPNGRWKFSAPVFAENADTFKVEKVTGF